MKFLAFCVHYRMFYIVCKYVFGDFYGVWESWGRNSVGGLWGIAEELPL